jgi:TonB family protein
MAMARLGAAFAVSALLHGAGMTALEQLPRGWPSAEVFPDRSGPRALHAKLRVVTGVPLAPSKSAGPAQDGKASRGSASMVRPSAYYPAHLLDERPQVRVHIEPAFPVEATVASGRVLLDLYIGTDGRVEELVISDAEPRGVFEQAAAQAFALAQFTPGKIRGERVRTVLSIEVLFGLPVPTPGSYVAADGPH